MSVDDLVVSSNQSLPYASPEVLDGNPKNIMSDVWSVGVILYWLSFQKLPFESKVPFQLIQQIKKSEPDYSSTHLNSDLISLLKSML